MLKQLPFLISGLIIGIILFQSFLIAPAINKLIPLKDASVLLRFIWPKFFIIIGSLSLISFLIFTNYTLTQPILRYLALLSFLLMSFCYFITPMINEAKDLSNNQLWTILHLTTIIMTVVTLLSNVCIILFKKF
tara:strand:- start:135 stop:536 length:402 start_codon:yes stop_codon:yes gene_type:complete